MKQTIQKAVTERDHEWLRQTIKYIGHVTELVSCQRDISHSRRIGNNHVPSGQNTGYWPATNTDEVLQIL